MHYFTLLCMQLVGLWGIFWFSYQPATQLAVAVGMAVAYVGWGIYHHAQHKNLHLKIVFEYILVAMLAVLIFGSILVRA